MVPGLSVFPSREPGMSGNFWMSHQGRQAPCLMLYEPSLIGFSQEPHLVPVQLCHILAG